MAAGCKHKEIVGIFELRFDYQSARTMLSEALREAGLEAASSYEAAEISAIATSLARLSPDATGVVDALGAIDTPAPEPPAAEPAAPEPPAAEPPAADDPPAAKPKPKAPAGKKKAGSKKTSKK